MAIVAKQLPAGMIPDDRREPSTCGESSAALIELITSERKAFVQYRLEICSMDRESWGYPIRPGIVGPSSHVD